MKNSFARRRSYCRARLRRAPDFAALYWHHRPHGWPGRRPEALALLRACQRAVRAGRAPAPWPAWLAEGAGPWTGAAAFYYGP